MIGEDPESVPVRTESVHGITVYRYATVSTTMAIAREYVRAGKTGIIVADSQTAGRGRREHHWYSPPGGFYCSWIRNPSRLEERHVSELTALAVVGMLKSYGVADCRIKLPNDIMISGGKIAGLLIQRTPPLLIVGLGININNTMKETFDTAVSLHGITGHETPLAEILDRFVAGYLRCVEEMAVRMDSLLGEWSGLLLS